MKPTAFEYVAPRTVEDVVQCLDTYGDEGKVLAGGQSLMPMMNFRVARPEVLIDIKRVEELAKVEVADGVVRIGSTVRQRRIESDTDWPQQLPLLGKALPHIGHIATRSQGTIGGSLSHADPAAELPVCMLALGAEMHLRSKSGSRTVPADDFFVDIMTTATEPTELLTEINVPIIDGRSGVGFQEVARRRGDFAIVSVAAVLEFQSDDTIANARIAVGGVSSRPILAGQAMAQLNGARPSITLFTEVGRAIAAETEPASDIHANAAYRRQMCAVLVREALREAASDVVSMENGHG